MDVWTFVFIKLGSVHYNDHCGTVDFGFRFLRYRSSRASLLHFDVLSMQKGFFFFADLSLILFF